VPVTKNKFVGQGFTILPNDAWKLLSNNGVLLLAYLLGKPENWEIRKENVARDLGWGSDKTKFTFAELKEVGYIRYQAIRSDDATRIAHWDIEVTNIPGQFAGVVQDSEISTGVVSQLVGKPSGVEATGVENPPISNKEVSNKDLTNTLAAVFDEIWSRYPRKVNRSGAIKAFKASVQRGSSIEDLAKAVDNYATACAGRDSQYVMHASTFFGPNNRWQDFLTFEADRVGSATIEQRDEIMRRALAEAKAEDDARRAHSSVEG
jgi:hypothetical protein